MMMMMMIHPRKTWECRWMQLCLAIWTCFLTVIRDIKLETHAIYKWFNKKKALDICIFKSIKYTDPKNERVAVKIFPPNSRMVTRSYAFHGLNNLIVRWAGHGQQRKLSVGGYGPLGETSPGWNHMWWYTKCNMKYCTRITLCESTTVLAEFVFCFFCWGEIINRSVQEKPSEARRCSQAWEVGDGQMDGRSVDVLLFLGLADTNLLGFALLEKSHCQVSSQLLIFNWKWQWWGFDESILSTIYKETLWISLWQKDRGLPTFLACLPWWGSRSTRCSQFSHEGYVHYDSWPGWQADTLQLLTFCGVFNCRWWMHHEHDGKVGCDGNL